MDRPRKSRKIPVEFSRPGYPDKWWTAPNVASVQKNQGDKSHRVIVALGPVHMNPGQWTTPW